LNEDGTEKKESEPGPPEELYPKDKLKEDKPTIKAEDLVGDEDSYEEDSNYDSEGNYKWGKEGEDWDFYYEEDRQAHLRGESTVPEPLNPQALPENAPENQTDAESTATSSTVKIVQETDGAVYKKKKKLMMQPCLSKNP